MDAAGVINQLASIGIDIEEVAEKLEREGIDKFIKPWRELIGNVEAASKGSNSLALNKAGASGRS